MPLLAQVCPSEYLDIFSTINESKYSLNLSHLNFISVRKYTFCRNFHLYFITLLIFYKINFKNSNIKIIERFFPPLQINGKNDLLTSS